MVTPTRQIVFDGSNVVQTRTVQEYSAPAENVIEYLRSQLGNSSLKTDILPRNCRAVFTVGDYTYYMIEVSPQTFTFSWSEGETQDPETEEFIYHDAGQATVAMPWQYFIFTAAKAPPNSYSIDQNLIDVKLLWALERFSSYSDPLFRAQIPNVDEYAVVCLGDLFTESNIPVADRIEEIVASFYTGHSRFNHDIGWNLPYGGDHEHWEAMTEKDPYCWRRWRPATNTLSHWTGFNPYSGTGVEPANMESLIYNALSQVGTPAW